MNLRISQTACLHDMKRNLNFETNLNHKPHTRTDTTLHQTLENFQDEENLQFSSPAKNSFASQYDLAVG